VERRGELDRVLDGGGEHDRALATAVLLVGRDRIERELAYPEDARGPEDTAWHEVTEIGELLGCRADHHVVEHVTEWLPVSRCGVAKGTKTETTKTIPVQLTLAAMLAEWKLGGWAVMMGRSPEPDDLVLPLPPATVAARTKRTGEPFRGYDYSGRR
jgi:hypothetical protein